VTPFLHTPPSHIPSNHTRSHMCMHVCDCLCGGARAVSVLDLRSGGGGRERARRGGRERESERERDLVQCGAEQRPRAVGEAGYTYTYSAPLCCLHAFSSLHAFKCAIVSTPARAPCRPLPSCCCCCCCCASIFFLLLFFFKTAELNFQIHTYIYMTVLQV